MDAFDVQDVMRMVLDDVRAVSSGEDFVVVRPSEFVNDARNCTAPLARRHLTSICSRDPPPPYGPAGLARRSAALNGCVPGSPQLPSWPRGVAWSQAARRGPTLGWVRRSPAVARVPRGSGR